MLYYIDNNAQLTFFSFLSCNVTIQHYEKHVGIGKVLFSSLFLFLFIHFPLMEKRPDIQRDIQTLESKITDFRTKKLNQFYKKRAPARAQARRQETDYFLQNRGRWMRRGMDLFRSCFAYRCIIGVLYQHQFTNNINVCKYL